MKLKKILSITLILLAQTKAAKAATKEQEVQTMEMCYLPNDLKNAPYEIRIDGEYLIKDRTTESEIFYKSKNDPNKFFVSRIKDKNFPNKVHIVPVPKP